MCDCVFVFYYHFYVFLFPSQLPIFQISSAFGSGSVAILTALDKTLRGCKPGNRHSEGAATYVIESILAEEIDAPRISAVLTTDTDFQILCAAKRARARKKKLLITCQFFL